MAVVNERSAQHPRSPDSGDSRLVRLTIPAKPEYITLCRLALTGLTRVRPLSEECVADLKLALTEAVSNSVRHAYGDGNGCVDVLYELTAARIAIEVHDQGEGFEHDVPDPDDTLIGVSEGGLGIAIIKSIADEFQLGAGAEGRGSRLRFAKNLSD